MDRELLLTRALDDGLPLLEAVEAARVALAFLEGDITVAPRSKPKTKKCQPVKDTKRPVQENKPEPVQMFTKNCLKCGGGYETDDPVRNRICKRCKNGKDWTGGAATEHRLAL